MSEHNHGQSDSSAPVNLPAKRKRGRPRKDGNLPRNNIEGSSKRECANSSVNGSTRTTIQNTESKPQNESIGKMVSGVVDGCFGSGAGFSISVRIGNEGPLRRGVIFEAGRAAHFPCTNEIPAQTSMVKRSEISTPFSFPSQQNQINNVGSQSVMKQPAQLGLQEQSVVLHQGLPSVAQQGSGSGSGSGLGSSLQLMNNSQSPSSMMPIGNMLSNNPILAEKMMMQQQAPRSAFRNQFQSSPSMENLRMMEQKRKGQGFEISVLNTLDTQNQVKYLNSNPSSGANIILYHKEISNQVSQNQDIGSVLQAGGANFGNNELQLLTESKEQRTQNMLQGMNLELHETPVAIQNQYAPQKNKYVDPDNESTKPEHETNKTSANTLHSISVEPTNLENQPDPGKMVGSKNDEMKEAFVPSNSHFLHRELFPESGEFVTEWPRMPKNEIENDNQSMHSEKHSGNGEIDSLTTENERKVKPFDLEIAAEEISSPPQTDDTEVSSFTACKTELNLVTGSPVSRTEAENTPASTPESQQP